MRTALHAHQARSVGPAVVVSVMVSQSICGRGGRYVGCYSGHRVIESQRRGAWTRRSNSCTNDTRQHDTPEQRAAAIRRAVRAIKRGSFRSYGEVARRAGLPGRARLVGQVLRESGDEPRSALASRHGRGWAHRVSGGFGQRAQAIAAAGARRRQDARQSRRCEAARRGATQSRCAALEICEELMTGPLRSFLAWQGCRALGREDHRARRQCAQRRL